MTHNLIDIFARNVAKTPSKPALIFNEKVVTYHELQNLALMAVTCLKNNHINTESKLGIVLPNCVEFVAIMLAAADMGIALVPQCPSLPANKILETFISADVDYIICWTELLGTFESAIASSEDHFNLIDINETTTSDPCASFSRNEDNYSKDYIVTLTSGSTGSPKPIVLKQVTKLNRISAAATLYSLDEDDIILAATPLYHSLAQRLVLLPLIIGGTSVLLAGYNILQWLKHISGHKVTFTIAVSSQLKQLLSVNTNEYDLSSLKCIVSSSELLPIEYKQPLLELLSCDFHECYGTSEIAIATDISFSDGLGKAGSVGRAIPSVDIAIIDDSNLLLPANTIGEICCKTPMAFAGYYKQPENTESSYFGGFFKTGDLGYLDADGFLFFSGRKKEIIISGGINIYPKDIEDTLILHEKVDQVCVIAIEDDSLGEVPVAVIVPISNDITMKELLRFSANKLAAYQIPRDFIFVSALAKNDIGKIQKSLVRQQVNLTNREI